MIRPISSSDAPAIAEIYNHYILNTTATFEEEPIKVEVMATRIANITNEYPWIVYEDNGTIIGYAYLNRLHARSAYRFTAEASVYLHREAQGLGIGTKLYKALFQTPNAAKIHSIIGGISLPNEASVRLHERFGFKKVAHYNQAGFKFEKWIDVGYWQKMMEAPDKG